MISATGLLSIIFFGSLLVYLVWRFLQKDEWLVYTGSRVIIWFLMIAMIRMVIPFELGFETSIYLGWGLPALRDFLITPLVFGEIAVSPGVILVTIWLIGAVICFSRSMSPFLQLEGAVRKTAVPCPAEAKIALVGLCKKRSKGIAAFQLICSPLVKVPMMVGWRSPVIAILDMELSIEEWSHVLRHEIAHYDNHDAWVKIFCEFVCAVYWWNPITSLLRSQLAKVLELHADEVVTQYMSDKETNDYMQCLVDVARISVDSPLSNCALAFATAKEAPVKQRFQLLSMSNRQTKEARQRHLVPSMLVCAALLIGAFSFILEPEYPVPDTYFLLDSDNTYLVLNEDGRYDAYMDGVYWGNVYSIRSSFSDLPVYNSIDEVTQNETP